MLILQNVSYLHPKRDLLFDNVNLVINRHDKAALIGNNGSGKSTLLKIIAGELEPAGGSVGRDMPFYYVPQHFGQHNHLTIAQALGIERKLNALSDILNGDVTEENFVLLNDDWTLEERCREALEYWRLAGLDLTQKMESLSGGQKTKVFLAGISIHQPELILLDEPSNHLDLEGRELLYDFIGSKPETFLVVSHDRKLLNLLPVVYELNKRGVTVYGGNYDFYVEQKEAETNALNDEVKNKEKALRKAKVVERETVERQQRLDARGKKKQEKAGVARIMMNTLRNNAEKSTSKLKDVHAEKIDGISRELNELRRELPDVDKMKFGFDDSLLHKGKILFSATDINFAYGDRAIWDQPLGFQVTSGERIALKGLNGSGKTSLIKIILGDIEPTTGRVYRAENKSLYIDQDYSLIDDRLTVYEQAAKSNYSSLLEHEIKIILNRFLFTNDDWNKPCGVLSGGEKMRLMLCCLVVNKQSPDIIILDEPTNNLDIQNIQILTNAINEYRGTLIVVSHDEYFLERINIERVIQL